MISRPRGAFDVSGGRKEIEARMSVNIRTKVRPILLLSALALLCLASAWGRVSQSELKYQDRGDRYEGTRGTPVSDKVELISALVNYKEDSAGLPEQFKLKFFLKDRAPVFITVREVDNRRDYWLDRVRPRSSWKPGYGNEFTWPTAEVVRPLGGLHLAGLGALVQLNNDEPAVDVRVAPAILYYMRPPAEVSGYLFAFRIGRKADVTCSVSRDADNSPVLDTQSFNWPGQRPRTVSWNAANAPEGWYRLRINVIYSNNGQEVNKLVRFYHRPLVS
jgi:hypothetical protein